MPSSPFQFPATHFAWLLAIIGAFGFGLSKTGFPGVGILAVAIFALAIPDGKSAGVALPVLIAADLVALRSFRGHAEWKYLWRLFPFAALGVVAGALVVHGLADHKHDAKPLEHMMGAILLLLAPVQLWRRQQVKKGREMKPFGPLVTVLAGMVAGFTTMLANASGPVMLIYLLGMGLPKMAFMGTASWFFFFINTFKVPFNFAVGMMSLQSLPISAVFAPVSVFGALVGRRILPLINQDAFELLALFFTVLAALKMLWPG